MVIVVVLWKEMHKCVKDGPFMFNWSLLEGCNSRTFEYIASCDQTLKTTIWILSLWSWCSLTLGCFLLLLFVFYAICVQLVLSCFPEPSGAFLINFYYFPIEKGCWCNSCSSVLSTICSNRSNPQMWLEEEGFSWETFWSSVIWREVFLWILKDML